MISIRSHRIVRFEPAAVPYWLTGLCLLLAVSAAVSFKLTILAVGAVALAWSMTRFPAFGTTVLIAFFILADSPLYQQYGSIAALGAKLTDAGTLLVLAGVAIEAATHSGPSFRTLSRAMPVVVAVAVYFGWTIATSEWSLVSILVLTGFFRVQVEAVVLLLLALLSLRSRGRVKLAMAGYAITGTVIAIYAVTHYALAANSVLVAIDQAYRGGNTGYQPNELALILDLVPIFAFLATEGLRWGYRFLATAVTLPPVVLALIILTSRSALFAAGAAIVVALVLARGGPSI